MEIFEAIVIPLSLLNDKGLVELAQKLNHYAAGKKLQSSCTYIYYQFQETKVPGFIA